MNQPISNLKFKIPKRSVYNEGWKKRRKSEKRQQKRNEFGFYLYMRISLWKIERRKSEMKKWKKDGWKGTKKGIFFTIMIFLWKIVIEGRPNKTKRKRRERKDESRVKWNMWILGLFVLYIFVSVHIVQGPLASGHSKWLHWNLLREVETLGPSKNLSLMFDLCTILSLV